MDKNKLYLKSLETFSSISQAFCESTLGFCFNLIAKKFIDRSRKHLLLVQFHGNCKMNNIVILINSHKYWKIGFKNYFQQWFNVLNTGALNISNLCYLLNFVPPNNTFKIKVDISLQRKISSENFTKNFISVDGRALQYGPNRRE